MSAYNVPIKGMTIHPDPCGGCEPALAKADWVAVNVWGVEEGKT